MTYDSHSLEHQNSQNQSDKFEGEGDFCFYRRWAEGEM